jgi:hypothetical protein
VGGGGGAKVLISSIFYQQRFFKFLIYSMDGIQGYKKYIFETK